MDKDDNELREDIMSRGKSKKSKNTASQNNSHISVTVPDNFDYQKFADAMFEAQKRAKEAEAAEIEKAISVRQADWHKILKQKEYPPSKYWFVNKFRSFWNGFKLFWKLITLKKSEAKYDAATFTLLCVSLSALLWLIKVALYIVAIGFVITSFYSFKENTFVPFNISIMLWAIIPFLLARIARIAQFEVQHIEDRNYLLGILSSMAAFIAMILSIISLMS